MTSVSVTPTRREPEAEYRGLIAGPRRPRIWTLVLSDTVAAVAAAALATFWQLGGSDAAGLHGTPTHLATAAIVPVWVLGLAACGAYGRRLLPGDDGLHNRVMRVAARIGVLLALVALLVDSVSLVRRDVIAVAFAALFTPCVRVLIGRIGAREYGGRRHAPRRALIVGQTSPIDEFLAHLRPADAKRLRVVAACVVDEDRNEALLDLPVPVVGGTAEIVRAARANRCDAVILLGGSLSRATLRRTCWDLHEAGVDVALAPIVADIAADRIAVAHTGGLPLLHLRAPVLTGPARRLTDLCQRAGALLILALLSPLMLVLAGLVRATSPGPALFRQTRGGKDGAEFTCLKFRTMCVDAESRKAELEHLNEMADGPLFKISKDPRLTRIGGALRRYSLDELPQLLNVLDGSMALVGPRPPLPAEVEGYTEEMRRRLAVKPGLTGLWQISGRSSLSWAESVRLDLNYVENWSPGLDAKILLRTTTAVVRGDGAF